MKLLSSAAPRESELPFYSKNGRSLSRFGADGTGSSAQCYTEAMSDRTSRYMIAIHSCQLGLAHNAEDAIAGVVSIQIREITNSMSVFSPL